MNVNILFYAVRELWSTVPYLELAVLNTCECLSLSMSLVFSWYSGQSQLRHSYKKSMHERKYKWMVEIHLGEFGGHTRQYPLVKASDYL